MTKKITDTDRLNYIQSLEYPVLEIKPSHFCMCSICQGYTLREHGSGKRSYSEDSLRDCIDRHIKGDLEDIEND